MNENLCKLNESKTECIIIGRPALLKHVSINQICLGSSVIKPIPSVKNLGVIFDKHFNLKQHITNVSAKSYYHLRNIYTIRKYLTRESCETLIHAFITRLDYCNSLYAGLPNCEIEKLQHIQNSAARLIYKIPKWEHISPKLNELHWLPIKSRIDYKILLFTFKALHNIAP